MSLASKLRFSLTASAFVSLPHAVAAATLSVVPASPFTGPIDCKAGSGSPACSFRPFDTSADAAFAGGGALSAVAKDTISGFPAIHDASFANDGYYGNGASWVSASSNSWIKIDLGTIVTIDAVAFGRDRLGSFDDHDPGQFTIHFATADDIYASGNDTNDGAEYTLSFDSSGLGFSGAIAGGQTLKATFDPIAARYVKLTFANSGVAIDEVEVHAVPIPAAAWFLGSSLLGLIGVMRRKSMAD